MLQLNWIHNWYTEPLEQGVSCWYTAEKAAKVQKQSTKTLYGIFSLVCKRSHAPTTYKVISTVLISHPPRYPLTVDLRQVSIMALLPARWLILFLNEKYVMLLVLEFKSERSVEYFFRIRLFDQYNDDLESHLHFINAWKELLADLKI